MACRPARFASEGTTVPSAGELELLERLRIGIEAGSDPEVVKKLTPMGQVVRPGPAAEFGAEIDEQRKVIAESAKRAGGK